MDDVIIANAGFIDAENQSGPSVRITTPPPAFYREIPHEIPASVVALNRHLTHPFFDALH